MVLDAGACGVIAPYVEKPEQVVELRGAVKFRPLKGKKLRDALRQNEPLEPELEGYIQSRNSSDLLIVNIESKPAVEALDEILEVPLDAVLIGPHDLSCSLGIPEQYDNPIFHEAVKTIIQKAKSKNVAAGIHNISDIELARKWMDYGANLLIHQSDILLFKRGLSHDLSVLRDYSPRVEHR